MEDYWDKVNEDFDKLDHLWQTRVFNKHPLTPLEEKQIAEKIARDFKAVVGRWKAGRRATLKLIQQLSKESR